jgi:hypothetical protein
MIGEVKMYHYCGSQQKGVGKHTMGYANITSCGVITESTTLPRDDVQFKGRYRYL